MHVLDLKYNVKLMSVHLQARNPAYIDVQIVNKRIVFTNKAC